MGFLCVVALVAGCAHRRPSTPAAKTSPPASVTPDLRPIGRVALVNVQARFVVITFPPGAMPRAGQQLSVSHRGVKVGEVKITGPQRENDTVADLIAGEANVGDEIKAE